MRLVGYIRVSRVGGREGEKFISPALQREQITALAAARGYEIIEWIEDLDESGGKWDRPGFQRALELVRAGAADGIIVARLDRFARSVVDALRAIEILNDAAGALVSVADNWDTTTAMGRAMLQIILVFAELERERQREGFDVVKRRAIANGIHISTLTPVGYRRGPDRRLVIDPAAARVVRAVFQRRARGDSWGQLAQYMDERLPRPNGGAWTTTTIAKMIRNRVYLGEAHQGDIVNPDAHQPLVTRADWEAAQPAEGRSRAGRKSGSLLSGLLRCGGCGGPLVRVSSLDYGCGRRRSSGVCPAPVTVRVARADEHVEQAFLAWAAAQHVRLEAAARNANIDVAVEALEQAEAELAAYRDANLISVIGRDAYVAGLQERADRVNAARHVLAAAQQTNVVPFAHLDAPSLWPSLTMRERRLLLDDVIDHVTVSGGALDGDRLTIVWRDAEHEPRLARAQDLQ